MATFTTAATSTSVPVPAKHGLETVTVVGSYSVSAALAVGDIVQFVKIPANAVVVDLLAGTSASLGSAFTVEFGDGNDTDRYFASANFGAGSASVVRLGAATGVAASQTSEDTLDMKVTAVTSGATGAVITVVATYYIP